jgi:hypothetical protein
MCWAASSMSITRLQHDESGFPRPTGFSCRKSRCSKAVTANATAPPRGSPHPQARRSRPAWPTCATRMDAPHGQAAAQDAGDLPTLPRGHPCWAGHRARPDVITGEQGAGKLASPVREGARRKRTRPWAPRRRPPSLDGGPLAKRQPWWVGHHAPGGKPAGLSLTTYRSPTSQRPTLHSPPGTWVADSTYLRRFWSPPARELAGRHGSRAGGADTEQVSFEALPDAGRCGSDRPGGLMC